MKSISISVEKTVEVGLSLSLKPSSCQALHQTTSIQAELNHQIQRLQAKDNCQEQNSSLIKVAACEAMTFWCLFFGCNVCVCEQMGLESLDWPI